MNWKVHAACDLNIIVKVKDFSGSQAVTEKVIISWKRC